MNDKENNNMQNNDDNGRSDDTKAFNWEWADNQNGKPDIEADIDSEKTEAQKEARDTNAKESSIPMNTDEGSVPDAVAEEITQNPADNAPTADDTNKNETVHNTDCRSKRNLILPLSAILSACSILLLIAFALSLMLGLFPLNGREVVFIGTSELGQTEPDVDVSPELLEDFFNSVVIIQNKIGLKTVTGTGIIVNENGYIVTNYHVIEGAETIAVQLYGEETAMPAKLIGFSENDDVAVIKIERTGLRAAIFADSDSVRYGEKVYAIGNPNGADFSWSVTRGIVSCPLREYMAYNEEGILEYKMLVVQTDAAVNHGNSGGPIINARGEVVGIVTFKLENSAGMGFALPSDGVLIDVKAILEDGHTNNVNSGIYIPRPIIGITGVGVQKGKYYERYEDEEESGVKIVEEDYAKEHPHTTFFADVTGVHVSFTTPGSDAAKYLKPGDIITEVNGNPITMIYDIMDIIGRYNGGDSVTVTYYRDGKYDTVTLTLMTSEN